MNKFKKSQILMFLLLAALVSITPFLSSSFRTTYLYFIINLLIFVLGAEAGLLSASSKSPEDTKPCPGVNNLSKIEKPNCSISTYQVKNTQKGEEKEKIMRKTVSDKSQDSVGIVKLDNKLNRSPSMPSLFFIGGEENEHEKDGVAAASDDYNSMKEEETEGLSGQELFIKAETFIGNFYKQLKMQRKESWKKIHGVY